MWRAVTRFWVLRLEFISVIEIPVCLQTTRWISSTVI
jgi:hypothetical protein